MREKLLACIEQHVPFDGWSEAAFAAAAQNAGLSLAQARAFCPRGALDLAVLAHRAGDARFSQVFRYDANLSLRRNAAQAVKLRLELAGDKEALRSATALFALPHRAPEGAKLLWQTVDCLWLALGDRALDGHWYSKRALLAGVYSASLLYWLGDQSAQGAQTDAFIARRIEEVLRLQKVQAHPLMSPLRKALSRISAPKEDADLPGRW